MSKSLKALFGRNPVMQFSRKAARQSHRMLSDTISPIEVSLGQGQLLTAPQDQSHRESVERVRTRFNMMKFDIQQRSTM